MINKEKVIRQLVDFYKKVESNTTTEERRDTITNTAEEIVKLFAIPDVSKRSELLIAFAHKWNDCDAPLIEDEYIYDYLEGNL